jgi:hypothetical protein
MFVFLPFALHVILSKAFFVFLRVLRGSKSCKSVPVFFACFFIYLLSCRAPLNMVGAWVILSKKFSHRGHRGHREKTLTADYTDFSKPEASAPGQLNSSAVGGSLALHF